MAPFLLTSLLHKEHCLWTKLPKIIERLTTSLIE
jgi:hypothetical protein